MTVSISIELSDVEYKALSHVALSPQEWVENAAKVRAQIAIEDIYKKEVERMMADPNITSIPANKYQIVMDANILTAAETNEQQAALDATTLPQVAPPVI
jgi:hypothetical protein